MRCDAVRTPVIFNVSAFTVIFNLMATVIFNVSAFTVAVPFEFVEAHVRGTESYRAPDGGISGTRSEERSVPILA